MVNFRIKPGVIDLSEKAHRMCLKKVRYESEEEAEAILHQQKRKAPAGNRLESYQCRLCSGWHLGHRGTDWKRKDAD